MIILAFIIFAIIIGVAASVATVSDGVEVVQPHVPTQYEICRNIDDAEWRYFNSNEFDSAVVSTAKEINFGESNKRFIVKKFRNFYNSGKSDDTISENEDSSASVFFGEKFTTVYRPMENVFVVTLNPSFKKSCGTMTKDECMLAAIFLGVGLLAVTAAGAR